MVNEIKMLRQIQHPNVIRLYETYESDQYVHMVLENLTDTSLFHMIRSKKGYTEADAARVMKSLLTVVNYLHGHQIIHRDIRPENIMIR
jgi:calcium-dependent protein kinase